MAEPRDRVYDRVKFRVNHKQHHEYKGALYWGELVSTEGPKPEDEIAELKWVEESGRGGMMRMDDEEWHHAYFQVTVLRPRPETDEEYFARKKEEAKRVQEREDRERLEYLRLKAKFEPETEVEEGASLYEVWNEGYAATGEHSPAQLVGVVSARSFPEAVEKALKDAKWDMSFFDKEKLTYWGCRFFDNEKDARKSFG